MQWVLHPDDDELKFILQVRGVTVNYITTDVSMRNVVDGGIHCSISGPQVFLVALPLHHRSVALNMEHFDNNEQLSHIFSQGSPSKKSSLRKKRYHKIISAGSVNDNMLHWNMPLCVSINN